MNDFASPFSPASQSRAGTARKNFKVLRGGADSAEGLGRVPIHSVEAEEQLLSVAMIDGGQTLGRCEREKIKPGAFYVPANRVIYEVLGDMLRRGLPVCMDVLAEELKTRGQLDEIGGYTYLIRVSGRVPTTAGASYFIEKVRELWVIREAVTRGTELVEACYDYTGPSPGAHVLPYLLKLQRLVDFADRTARGPDHLLERFRNRVARTLAEVAGTVDKSKWLSTGDAYMDSIFLPFDPNEEDWLIVVGGPPSGGKSAWMRQVCMANVRAGKKGAVFLLETGLRWAEQAACSSVRLNFRARHEWTVDMVKKYEAAAAEVDGLIGKGQLYIAEDVFAVEDIERAVRELNRAAREREIQAGVPEDKARGLDFIVVDYLQLLDTRANQAGRMTREQVVATISRTLKLMLKQLNIVGFIGAQINRAGRDDPARVPTLKDLRESGAIEQDADRVIFVHTPPTNRAGVPQTGSVPIDEVEIHQRKSRNGPRDVSVQMLFEKRFTLYRAPEGRPGAAPGLPKPAGGYARQGGEM